MKRTINHTSGHILKTNSEEIGIDRFMEDRGFRRPTKEEREKYGSLIRSFESKVVAQVGSVHLTSAVYRNKSSSGFDKRVFVERRPQGDYVVRRAGSERASAVESTQAKAIERARKLNPGVSPQVERVRHTSGGNLDKWRKA
jgi:hypothetical protein